MVIISATRVVVDLNVTQGAVRGSLSSTMTDGKIDDDAFLDLHGWLAAQPINSPFVQIDAKSNRFPTQLYLHKASTINK